MNALQSIHRKEKAASRWRIAFLVLAFLTGIEHVWRFYSDKHTVYLIVGPTGEYFPTTHQSWEKAREMHFFQTRFAMESLFSRTESGPDHPDLLERMFENKALLAAKRLFAREGKEFEAKELHQKVEVGKIAVLTMADRAVRTQATAQLIRTGAFEGQPIQEGLRIKVAFLFRENQAFGSKARYPSRVVEFEIVEQTPL